MKFSFRAYFKRLRSFATSDIGGMMLLFGIEGIFLQFATSVNSYGNNLYATNLGATDSQLGLVQTIPNLITVCSLLPIGVVANRMKSSKPLLVALLVFMGVMYCGYATVPVMGEYRIGFFFFFLGMTVSTLQTYNAQWQTFFGDTVRSHTRNLVYSFRNRFMMFAGMIAPLLCSAAMMPANSSEQKLSVLRIFFYICGGMMFLQAVAIARMKDGERSPALIAEMKKFSVRDIGSVLKQIAGDKRFLAFFGAIMLFYFGWHLDFSLFYIAQTQYCGFTAVDLGYYSSITCLAQLLSIGFWSRLNGRKSVYFTFIFGASGLVLGAISLLLTLLMPQSARVIALTILVTISVIPQTAINICVVQMLLNFTPKRNRAMIISLYTIAVTLSNSLVPYLGVEIYIALGSSFQAIFTVFLFILLVRVAAVLVFLMRYLKMKRDGILGVH